MKTKLCWHFLPNDGVVPRLNVKATKGLKLHHEGKVELCASGLHASVKLMDALGFAPGSILERVRVSGTILTDTDKLVASDRETLWIGNVEKELRLFACDEAEAALKAERKAGREPHQDSWNAVKVTRDWVAGKASNAASHNPLAR